MITPQGVLLRVIQGWPSSKKIKIKTRKETTEAGGRKIYDSSQRLAVERDCLCRPSTESAKCILGTCWWLNEDTYPQHVNILRDNVNIVAM